MKAIVVRGEKGRPELVWDEVVDVACGPEEVVVAVRATAVNRADLLQARGGYPPPPGASDIIGLEMAGEIVALGEGVVGWEVGDRVCALLPGGGYAELTAVPYQMLVKIPDNWSFAQAAAFPEVWYTAYLNLFGEGQLKAGEVALIHAGGSGVGTAAVQLAVLAGAQAFVTAGTEEKLQACRELGATLAVNYKTADFLPAVLAATNNRGVDVILDPVGAGYLMKNLRALAINGRLVSIGLLSGGQTEINLGLLLGKRLRLIGSTLRNRPLAEKVAIRNGFEQRFWPFFASGQLQPIIDTTFPITEAQAAHEYVAADKNIGKVVLLL
ncbi:MAG: NAD(P)H-quinone oxidoreductase [Anaerolineales bacterium]|nr:NAD(P)H-quinone oxidoreductase [Anaerolineales bacterium]